MCTWGFEDEKKKNQEPVRKGCVLNVFQMVMENGR